MTDHQYYAAILAEGSTVPTLLCGHCRSILPRGRIIRNNADRYPGVDCQTIGLCSADDCGAVNCCDNALARVEDPQRMIGVAS